MKKGLFVFSIITTAFAVFFFSLYCSSYVGFYESLEKAAEEKEAVASFFAIFIGGALAGTLLLVLNVITIISALINFIPNVIHFKHCKNPVVIVFFGIACALLLAPIIMLICFIASGAL